MATVPTIKYTSKEQLAGMRLTDEKNGEKSEKKLTVLESHGYALGKTIGAGSYATVKVIYRILISSLFLLSSYYSLILNIYHVFREDREVRST